MKAKKIELDQSKLLGFKLMQMSPSPDGVISSVETGSKISTKTAKIGVKLGAKTGVKLDIKDNN